MLEQSDRRTFQIPEVRRPTMNDIRDTFAHQGLMRPRQGRVLAGVCAGLGRRFGLDPWPARLLFLLVLLVIPGSQLLIYPILWLLMPDEGRAYAASRPAGPVAPSAPPAPAV
jgi:phage shock protein C